MSKEEVKDSELLTNPDTNKAYKQKPKSDSENEICYDANIYEIEGDLIYKFLENKLIGARYDFTEKYEDKDILNYVRNYLNIKKLLTKKYGKPEPDEPKDLSSLGEFIGNIKLWENTNQRQCPAFAVWLTLSKTYIYEFRIRKKKFLFFRYILQFGIRELGRENKRKESLRRSLKCL